MRRRFALRIDDITNSLLATLQEKNHREKITRRVLPNDGNVVSDESSLYFMT